jgi:ATP-dependent DNA helicase RecQ
VPDIGLCSAVAAITHATNVDEVRRALGQPRGRTLQAVLHLHRLGVVRFRGDGVIAPGAQDFREVRDGLDDLLTKRSTLQATRRDMMDAFVEADSCRWSMITGYLGHAAAARCGHCDICRHHDDERTDATPLGRITHRTFGSGQLVNDDGEIVTVLFDDHGYRTLSRTVLDEESLIV